MEASYKCGSCLAIFTTFEEQREHYKGDWHRFNLKRKIVQLPPITELDFCQKVAPRQSDAKNSAPIEFRCVLCNKTFSSAKSLEQHYKSKVHLKMVEKKKRQEERRALRASESDKTDTDGDKDMTLTSSESEAEAFVKQPELTYKHCLFDNKLSKTRTANLTYMAKTYGLFIPDAEYLADLTGFLDYLILKISKHYQCLYCNRVFNSQAAVQDHMRSVNHCKIKYETDEDRAEYSDFYDFTSSYAQYQERLKLVGQEVDEDMEGEEKKKEGEEEGDEKAVLLLEDAHKGNVTVTNAGYELIFSNGKAVGHRDFQTYYKQKPRTVDTRESVRIAKMMAEYKMLGYAPIRNERHFVDKKTQRMQAKHHMQVGVKGNKLFKVRLQVREC